MIGLLNSWPVEFTILMSIKPDTSDIDNFLEVGLGKIVGSCDVKSTLKSWKLYPLPN